MTTPRRPAALFGPYPLAAVAAVAVAVLAGGVPGLARLAGPPAATTLVTAPKRRYAGTAGESPSGCAGKKIARL